MQNVEVAILRRQVLDWRDKWMEQIPVVLDRELSCLLALLNAQIDQISFKETLSAGKYAEKNIQPIYKSWVVRASQNIMDLAHKDLKSIDRHILDYNSNLEYWIASDTSGKNVVNLSIASGSAGAAVLGIPVVQAFSTVSAGWGLGLLGVTVISWPAILGGAAVLGTMAVFGGTKLARHREKAIQDFKGSVEAGLRSAVLATHGTKSSLTISLQEKIRTAAAAYMEELKSA
ncbi:hypothetical protein SAMN04488490_0244 [Marinobacter sp. LV10R510-11A]|nr:hypothetical protein SAMN04488490_0244 [Marinobacter sp. LV10R510-11A]